MRIYSGCGVLSIINSFNDVLNGGPYNFLCILYQLLHVSLIIPNGSSRNENMREITYGSKSLNSISYVRFNQSLVRDIGNVDTINKKKYSVSIFYVVIGAEAHIFLVSSDILSSE